MYTRLLLRENLSYHEHTIRINIHVCFEMDSAPDGFTIYYCLQLEKAMALLLRLKISRTFWSSITWNRPSIQTWACR
jgi:hypothetical protein